MRAPEVRRIALMGGESSGKTSLAVALAEQLGTAWVPEYGRQRWEELRETLDQSELLAVARRQVALEEEAVAEAQRAGKAWVVCDTTPLTTLQYCLYDHGAAPPELHALADRPYHRTVVCNPDFDFVQDGCRRDDHFRAEQHAWTLAQLRQRGVSFVVASGSVSERVRLVRQALALPDPLPVP